MLNVETIKNGLVIDHICAGYGPKIFNWLGLANARFTAALVMNVQSKKGGKKDIIKIDNIINIDYSVLGFIDPNITVNVIKDEKIVEKIKMELPQKVTGVIHCKNPPLFCESLFINLLFLIFGAAYKMIRRVACFSSCSGLIRK